MVKVGRVGKVDGVKKTRRKKRKGGWVGRSDGRIP
jgi:hypothetical protein